MKKSFKKLGAVVLALAMCMSLACTAFAAGETDGKITITNVPASDQVFEAWQIFAGDLGSDGKTLSNITWGSGVSDTITNGDGENVYQALAEITIDSANPFTDENGDPLTTAAEVAAVMDGAEYNAEIAQKFADVIHDFLTGTPAVSGDAAEDPANEGKYIYTIENLDYGYYLIDDQKIGENEAYTDYLLTVVNDDATIVAKEDTPPLDKTITDVNVQDGDEGQSTGGKSDDGKSGNASIGDKIEYTLTSQVPSMEGYNYYIFNVTDTMSKGLTFNNDVEITIGNLILTAATVDESGNVTPPVGIDTWYYVTTTENADGSTTITIVFHDFIQYKENYTGQTITITYSAELNEDAVIGTTGNPNDAKLIYSNDPNTTYGGTDIPEPGEPTGETPESRTYTYTTGIQLDKVDENGVPLTGAEFTLSGVGVNYTVTVEGVYTEDPDGTYWKLADGSYTETAPTDATAHLYDNTETKYKFETQTSVKEEGTEGSGENVYEVTAWVDEDGIVRFSGLAAGTYTITETVVPDGYNKIDDITVVISWEAPATVGGECTWTATASTMEGQTLYTNSNGVFEIEVVNNSGTELPSTGGIGTTIFYIIGGVLVVGAVVVLVTRRRMSREG